MFPADLVEAEAEGEAEDTLTSGTEGHGTVQPLDFKVGIEIYLLGW